MNKMIKSDGKYTYYQSLFGRNVINTKVVPAFLQIICLPKLVVEVFIRRRMGERYFSSVWAVLAGIILYWLPDPLYKIYHWHDTPTYFVFFTGYVIMSVYTYFEIRRAPSVFDFKRFSLDPGKSLPFFHRIKIFGKTPTQRTIDVYLEPLLCLLVGFLLILGSQYMTGTVIFICSLCHFISNLSFAIRGDHFIMDKIDQIICNQDLSETFVQDRDMSPRGVPFYAQKPTTKELREGILDTMSDFDSDAAVAS